MNKRFPTTDQMTFDEVQILRQNCETAIDKALLKETAAFEVYEMACNMLGKDHGITKKYEREWTSYQYSVKELMIEYGDILKCAIKIVQTDLHNFHFN